MDINKLREANILLFRIEQIEMNIKNIKRANNIYIKGSNDVYYTLRIHENKTLFDSVTKVVLLEQEQQLKELYNQLEAI